MLKVKYKTNRQSITEWRYFWAKTVIGFDPRVHCARCLIGDYQKKIGLRMEVNEAIPLDIPDGMLLYICGVSMPYRWQNNFHLVLRVKEGARTQLKAYNGDTFAALNAERVTFDEKEAVEQYPSLGKEFLTCRNFQFGATFGKTLPTAQRIKTSVTPNLPGM